MVLLFDQFNLPDDVYEIVFATEQQVDVAKQLIIEFKRHKGVMDKTQMSEFATALHDGKLIVEKTIRIGPAKQIKKIAMSYNKRQFYDRILTPMKSMGMIDFDLYAKTYKLSENFSKSVTRLAQMWNTETKKPAGGNVQ